MQNNIHFEPTHFILQYSVLVKNIGTQEIRVSNHDSGVREMKYLDPLLKCFDGCGEEIMAIWRIQFKQPLSI